MRKWAFSMRMSVLCMAILAAWSPPVVVRADAPVAAAAPLVVNGGFEDWQAAPDALQEAIDCHQLPTGWSLTQGLIGKNYSVACDSDVKHDGNSALRLANTDTKGGLYVAQRVPAEPETRYKIGFWLKGQNIDSYSPKGVVVHVVASSQSDLKDGNQWAGNLGDAYQTPSPNGGTFDWHSMVFTFDTPLNARSISLRVNMNGAGTLWLDDVEIIPLEKCIEVESY